jgi:autotransporter-associated beta strand protein
MRQEQIHTRILAGLPPAVGVSLILLAAAAVSHAAVITWNGAGDGTTMSSGANWSGGVAPVPGTDAIIFDGTTGTNVFNDFPGGNGSPAFAGITFAAGAGSFTITNNPLSLAVGTGITNLSANLQYFQAAIEHNGAAHVYNASNGPMKFDAVNGRANGNVAIKAGAYDMFLTSAIDNNGTVFVVTNGTLICNKTGPTTSRAIGGTAPTTVYTNATVRIQAGSSLDQIFARVKLNMLGGTLQVQNTNEGISNLAGWTNSAAGIAENGLAGTTNTLTLGDENNHRAIYYGTIRDGAAGVLNLTIARNTLQQFHGTHTYSGTTTISNVTLTGTTRMIMNGTHVGGGAYLVSGHPTTVDQLATLNGSGLISASAINLGIRGVIAPGGNWSADSDTGTFTETLATLTFSNALVNLTTNTSTLDMQVNGTNAGSYDLIAVVGTGTVSNNNGNLKLAFGYAPVIGDKITLVSIQGTNAASNAGAFGSLNGTVTDLSQGATFIEPISGQYFKISYRAEGSTFDMGAGKGNDIMIQAVAAPGGALTWRGDVNNAWDIATTANWRTNGIATTFAANNSAIFDDTGTNNLLIDLTTDLSPGTISVNATNNYVFTTSLAGKLTGNVVLIKTNSGTLSIVTDNDNTGSLIIQRGVVQVGTNGTIGTLSGAVNVTSNGMLAYNRSDDTTISTAAFNGAGTFVHNGSGQLTIAADMTAAFTGTTTNSGGLLQFGNGSANLGQIGGTVVVPSGNSVNYYFLQDANINNALAGNGTVTYDTVNGGTLNLATTAVSSNFTGIANISIGTRVHANNGSSFPFGNGSVVNVPADAQAWCDTAVYNNTFNIAGVGWGAPDTGAISVFNATFTGAINLLANARISGTIAGGSILCPISGSYELEIKGNPGSYVLNMGPTNGVHSYASTLITSGSVRALNTNAISTGALTMDNWGADLRLNGNDLTVASLTSINTGGTPTNATIQNVHASTPATLTVGTDGSSTTFEGVFGNGGVAPLGLTKVGAGTLTISGINTNTGTVTVNGGTLALSGSGSFGNASKLVANATLDVSGIGGTLALSGGQTLGGSGTVTGEVVAPVGSTVSPGASVGTLTVSGNVSLGGLLQMELNRTNSPFNCDRLVSSGGTITYGGSLLITNIGPVLQVNDTFQVFPSGVGAFGVVTVATTDASGNIYTWQNDIASLGSVKVLSVTAPVNTTPTNIVASVSGGNLNLSWPSDHTGWSLQTQTNVLGVGLSTNWFTVPGSSSTNEVSIPINPANPAVFFRLQYP